MKTVKNVLDKKALTANLPIIGTATPTLQVEKRKPYQDTLARL